MRIPFNKPNQDSVTCVKQLQEKNYNLILPQSKQFVGYPVIVAIMAVLQVLTVIFGSKGFIFFGYDITAGWLILMPINFFLFQIIAECYGWQYARQIIWLNSVTNLVLFLVLFFFNFLPVTGITHKDTQHAYLVLLSPLWFDALLMLVSMFFADLATALLTSWSRFHWKGRHLILRTLILHCVAELIMGCGWVIVGPFYNYSIAESLKGALDSFYARSIIMLCMLPIAYLAIKWIQNRLEEVIVFDLNIRFAPFKFRINPDESVQFIAQEWQLLSREERAQIDIPQFVMKHFASQAIVKVKIY